MHEASLKVSNFERGLSESLKKGNFFFAGKKGKFFLLNPVPLNK